MERSPAQFMPASAWPTRALISSAALSAKVRARISSGTRVPVTDQARDALHQHAGLPGAGARHHQHGSVDVFDGLELPLVESDRHRFVR